jgi:hypothetical protein
MQETEKTAREEALTDEVREQRLERAEKAGDAMKAASHGSDNVMSIVPTEREEGEAVVRRAEARLEQLRQPPPYIPPPTPQRFRSRVDFEAAHGGKARVRRARCVAVPGWAAHQWDGHAAQNPLSGPSFNVALVSEPGAAWRETEGGACRPG